MEYGDNLSMTLSSDDSLCATIQNDTVPMSVSEIGIADHSLLQHLDYESSGHTGFASSEELAQKQDILSAGNGIDITDNVVTNTGVTNIAVNASGGMTIWQGIQSV